MVDITAAVDPLVAAIYSAYEARNVTELPRGYLGASIVGRPCERSLWYGFRWAAREQFEGRVLRMFQTGFMAEPRFVADLRAVGVTVHEVDPRTGRQFAFSDLGGHMRGNMDACAHNVPGGGGQWHAVEFKTHAAKSFTALKKDGVRKSKPEHYNQVTCYMGWSGMRRALYLAVNKDTDELYSERLEFDPTAFAATIEKAARIIFTDQPPPRISEDPKYYVCGWCPFKAVCHGGRVPAVSCRTCVHATPEREGADGRWSCAKHQADIPLEAQRAACPAHLPLPHLLTFAQPIDAAGDATWVLFRRHDDGKEFAVAVPEASNVPCAPEQVYTSREVSAAHDHRMIGDDGVAEFRAKIPGTRISA